MKDAIQIGAGPAAHAVMAASYGHRGDIAAGRDALAAYRQLTPLPPEALIRGLINDPPGWAL